MKRLGESVTFEMPGAVATRLGATGNRSGETLSFEMVGAVRSGGGGAGGGGGGGAISR